MLTTKKWGQLSVGKAALECSRPAANSPAPGATLELILAVLLWAGVVGCTPAGPKALATGDRLLRDGHAAEAIPAFKEAIILLSTNTPACAQAWNHLGLAYHYSGRPALADLAYQKALEKDFNLFAARYNRGCLALEQNNLPTAASELITYVTHRPEQAQGWLRLGTAYLRLRQVDAAERCFQQTLKLNPRQPEAWNGLGLTQALRRRPREAFRYLHAALKCQTNYPPALLNEAIIAQEYLRDYPLALERYNAYLACPGALPREDAVKSLARILELELHPPPPAPARVAAQPPAPHRTNLAAVSSFVVASNTAPPAVRPTAVAAVTPPRETPPAVVKSNPPPVVTSPPPPPAESAKPAPREAATPPREVPPAPATNPPPPPLEVVKLTSEPTIPPAQDLSLPAVVRPPTAPPQPPPSPAAPTVTQAPPPKVSSSADFPPLLSLSKNKGEKESFFRRLNPLRWGRAIEKANPLRLFSSKKQAEAGQDTTEATNSLPTAPVATPPPVATQPAQGAPLADAEPEAAAPAPTAPAPPPPVIARYAYRNPPAPAPGDHAAAARFFAEGLTAQRGGHVREAMAAYEKATAADPALFAAHYNLGVAAHQEGEWPLALTEYETALALQPTDATARFNFALALAKANYPLDAAEQFRRILARRPEDVEAHFGLANLYAQALGQPGLAKEEYLKVLQLAPHHPQAPQIRLWVANHP